MGQQAFQGTIEITGHGHVEVMPDEAIVQLRVITEGKTAEQAVAANATATQQVIDAVSGVPNHGISTFGLGVSPMLRYDQATGTSRIVGFRATDGVRVRTKVDHAARVFDEGIAAGANQSSGIDYRLQNDAPYRAQALQLAVDDAFAQARVLADAAEVELCEPMTISTDVDAAPPSPFRTAALESGAVPTPTLPGELSIPASVRIVFRSE
ncbi:SIMPL domain-containing protein [Paraliomyxa miuraensis]|uniref:SIMPL domain-containing protein n=1 Tax=Paraliomyxa miuraensis TaxID=376150 RepID=UPI00225A3FCF|nr:SIMPL domain-containing protein [Paraliomyxa miuraensis]MCX4240741.1 SIMPL domain-containing protein [Paraliomyxa miuraensis]